MGTKGDLVMGCRKEIDYYKSKKSRKKQKSLGKNKGVQVKTKWMPPVKYRGIHKFCLFPFNYPNETKNLCCNSCSS